MRLDANLIKSQSFLIGCLILAATTVLAPEALQAQNPGQSQDRAQLLRSQARPSYDPDATSGQDQGYAVASPNDKDLGQQQILKRAAEYNPFTLSFASAFYYTSNVALTSSGEEEDVLFAPGFAFTYQPRFTQTLYGEFSLVQQFFYYDEFSELNFTSFDAIAGVVYFLPQFHNLILRARYDFNRLTDDDFDEFFSKHSIILGAELPFRIGRAQQVAVGVSTEFVLAADPDEPGRNDYSFYVGYSANLSRSFSIDASARIAIRDYDVGDRTDVSEILALSANYRIGEYFTLSFLSSLAWNQSDQSVFDYSVANVGGGVAATFRF